MAAGQGGLEGAVQGGSEVDGHRTQAARPLTDSRTARSPALVRREDAEPEPPDEPSGWYPHFKRALDAVLALVQAVVCLPAWIVVPLAIKLEDGGPVFYGQKRVGKRGELFTSWKFRSMTPRSEDGPLGQAELEEDRVTRVGRVLRATALDELPQLWNIVRGDMSYVGPRPLLPEERSAARSGETVRLKDLRGYKARHRVRPGLTGLAQVRLPRDAPHTDKFRLDVAYVRRRSLALDVKLIVQSIGISLRGAWPEVGEDEEEGS